MKSHSFAAVLAIVAALSFTSCNKDEVKFYSFEISLDESGFAAGVPSPDAYKVTFTNTNTGEVIEYEITGKTVPVKDLMGGVYDVVASATASIYNFLGTAKSVVIESSSSLNTLKIVATKSSSIIFKEVFYSCSRTPSNATYLRDNFFEIYNNGSEPVYVDGLCMSTTSNYSGALINFADENGNLVLSEGTVHTNLKSDDYVALNNIIWQIPGNGKTYLLNPGESFIIASSAVNHTEANANTLDLSSAEFETVCDNYIAKGQVDNENVPNLILINPANANITNQWMPSTLNAGLVLFAPSTPLEKAPIVANYNNPEKPSGNYLAILRSDVLDGVNWKKNAAATDLYLPENLDAGAMYVSGTFVNESIYRKSSGMNEAGDAILVDTNNSASDFEVSKKPEIRRGGSKKASWSK